MVPMLGSQTRATDGTFSFLSFVKSHLTGLVDVNVTLRTYAPFDKALDTFLQIKTLKRLRLSYQAIEDLKTDYSSIYKSTLVPQCRDLVLLNLADGINKVSPEGMENIVRVR